LTKQKKVSQRGLLAAAIMLPLILVFYSLPDAQAADTVIKCSEGDDIDNVINSDPKTTATRFVLEAGCTFVASRTIVPINHDVVACEDRPDFVPLTPTTAFDPITYCTVEGPGVENVFRPIGQGGTTATVHFEGIRITGGKFTGSSGSGAAIAEGSMTTSSTHIGIEVMDNGAAGILTAKGTFDKVEFTRNTLDRDALGFIAAGIKARNEIEVRNSYIHETQGNGIWCDGGCVDAPNMLPEGFYVHDNLVVNNGRAGVRYENSTNKATIENNDVGGNSFGDVNRGGISVRDAQEATIQNNRLGIPHNSRNIAISASDSGRSSRPNLLDIDIMNNTLNGEIIKGCELPDDKVLCQNNR
jgi:hypothetical protein